MVRVWMFILLFVSVRVEAQVNCFATVKFNRTSVYPEQPIKASITVLTETWFTQPLDFESVIVPSAFVIPFKRTQSGVHHINGKQYAGLEFFYLIYPYETGEFDFPEVVIHVETPPVGDYRGEPVTVRTKPKQFTVREIPSDFTGEDWFLAKNVNLYDNWSKPLVQIQVGDVVERTITIGAAGTLPTFIPELTIESLDFASVYFKDSKLKDERDNHDAHGLRTEKRLYLFEKEGDFEIPSVRVEWWNPYSGRMYYREIEEIKVSVASNPNLGMLLTVKDSLDATVVGVVAEEDDPWEYMGLNWWQFGIVVLIIGVLFFVLIRLVVGFVRLILKRRNLYLNSEKYYLHRLDKASSAVEQINASYDWLDRFGKEGKSTPKWRDLLTQYFGHSNAASVNGLKWEDPKMEAPDSQEVDNSQKPFKL